MARVLIAIPTFESVSPDTFKSLWDMGKGGNECSFETVRGYDCATARNRIAQMALDGGYDRLMMVDSDVTVPPGALADLLSHGVDFASGFYLRRSGDGGETCAYRLLGRDGKPLFNYEREDAYTAGELAELRGRGERLVEVHGGGMGCVLVNVDVFRRIAYPWFDWVNYRDGRRGMLSEDLYFCEELRKAGIPRYVDTRVACGHLFRRIEEAL